MHGTGFVKIFLIILALGFLLDWYVFNGLKTLTAGWRSRRGARLVKWGYLLVSVGVTVMFVVTLPDFRTAKGMRPFHEWIFSLFLVFFITKVFFVLVLFLGDIGRFFYGGVNLGRRPDEPFFPALRSFPREFAPFVPAIPFPVSLYTL